MIYLCLKNEFKIIIEQFCWATRLFSSEVQYIALNIFK